MSLIKNKNSLPTEHESEYHMLNSMTAFARAEENINNIQVVVEIRSLNSKNLDMILRLAPTYYIFEDQIKKSIQQCLSRGRVETMISIQENVEDQDKFEANIDRATEYVRVLNQIIDHFQLNHPLNLRDIMKAGGIIKPIEKENNLDSVAPIVMSSLNRALDNLCIMRATEGLSLAKDLENRLGFIDQELNKIIDLAQGQVAYYQQKLKDRIAVLTNNIIEVDPLRIAQEAAILADRSDISEEIIRLQSHIQQFRNFMEEDAPVGRKLNFLLQEMGREVNTIGSKSGNVEISKIIVTLKSEHEKIREQIQNIE
ncbi:MAG: YicC family protein [Candidatus Magnetomorum sp.]|nr:YicC family protein [Candidatus Magnetomorum sp.]